MKRIATALVGLLLAAPAALAAPHAALAGATMDEDRWAVIKVTIGPASVSANTSAEQASTITGLKANDFVSVNKPTTTTHLVIGGLRVSVSDALAIALSNLTGSPIDAASETYKVFIMRPEKTPAAAFNP